MPTRRTFVALALAATHPSALAVPQWSQNGGNRARTGVSPATWGLAGSEGSEPVAPSEPGVLRTVQPLGAPYPITYTTRVLQYEATLSSDPILSKTPCPVVLSDGTVVATLPADSAGTSPTIAVKLVNPDRGSGGGWSLLATADSGQAVSTDPLSVDIVADDNDNTFLLVDDRNSALSGIDGFVVGWDSALSPLSSWGGAGTVNLQSNLRTLELYHVSATMGGSNSNGAQRLFMGLATLESQRGLAIVSTDSSCSTDTAQCGANPAPPGPITGPTSCCLLSPKVSSTDVFAGVIGSAYLDGTGLLGLLTYSLNARGAALAAFAEDGTVKWTTDGSRGGKAVNFKAHINQPNPTIDPFTKNVYWVGVLQSGEATQNRIYCVNSNTGAPCPQFASADNGNPLNVQAAFNGVEGISIGWAYQLSIVPDTTGTKSSRLLLSFTTAWSGAGGAAVAANPTGCVVSLSLLDGSMLDSYCIPRDVSSFFYETNYLATSPIVAKDARGAGQHTVLVAQFDIIVFAFDPMNLEQGPLYAVDPFQDAGKEAATVSTDYLALTTGGTVIFQGWDDTKNEYTILAIPGILLFPPTLPTPTVLPSPLPSPAPAPAPAPRGSSSGAGVAAGATIGVLAGLGLAAGAGVWWVGGSAAALALLRGKGVGAYSGAGYTDGSSATFRATGSSGGGNGLSAASYGSI